MKTKIKIVGIIKKLTLLISFGLGAFNSSGMIVFSQPTDNIYVGICGDRPHVRANGTNYKEWATNNTPIRYDEKLSIMFFCKTGSTSILIPGNKGVFIRFTLYNKQGAEVMRTAEGALWGKDIKHFPKAPGMKSFDKMADWGTVAGPDTKGFQGWPSGPSLPAAKDLFEMTTNGIYDLKIQVHLMEQHMVGTNNWTWEHIEIPSVKVKVEKA